METNSFHRISDGEIKWSRSKRSTNRTDGSPNPSTTDSYDTWLNKKSAKINPECKPKNQTCLRKIKLTHI
jgi:hypothetical protein